nr:reverse transcriptase domain-containing protein [Tanacetum cinerariifolium]
MGNGCPGPTCRGPKDDKIYNYGSRLFHEVDRSKTAGQNNWEGSEEIRQRFSEKSKQKPHGRNQYSTRTRKEGEAVIPAEICMPTHQTMMIKDVKGNEEEIRLNLDLLQERREAVAIREVRYKMEMEHSYNKRVRPVSFKVGKYIYRKNKASRVENLGNLGPKWEGPYLVGSVSDWLIQAANNGRQGSASRLACNQHGKMLLAGIIVFRIPTCRCNLFKILINNQATHHV